MMKTSLIFAIIALTTVDACGMRGQILVAGDWSTPKELLNMTYKEELKTLMSKLGNLDRLVALGFEVPENFAATPELKKNFLLSRNDLPICFP